ncbi:energy transducer TonB [Sanyastnella coralliicola]|uniref:energy transducer TonB n=1 Tax=Sanyastnella coralliicola TaxID=3069118 RepID=UPI0027B9357F|nr:energy transducer TonB [Longitalea sp. SCSIO 12813]
MRLLFSLTCALITTITLGQTAPTCAFPNLDKNIIDTKQTKHWADGDFHFVYFEHEGYNELFQVDINLSIVSYKIWLTSELTAANFEASIQNLWMDYDGTLIFVGPCGNMEATRIEADRWEPLHYIFNMQESNVVIEEFRSLRVSWNAASAKKNVYMLVEQMPYLPTCKDLPGKRQADCTQEELSDCLAKRVVYSKEAVDLDATGTVFISIEINEFGFVQNAKVLREVHPLLDKASIDAAYNLPPMEPGKHFERIEPDELLERPVIVHYTLPVKFEIR